MLVAVVADSHFDEHKRFEECIALHAWIRQDAERRGVTMTLHAGDVFERKSTPRERAAAFPWFQDMADLGPVVVVRGNHDAVDDLPLLTKLDSAHPITVVEETAVVEVGEALVACVAWPRKSAVLAASGAAGHESSEAIAADALRDVMRGLSDELHYHEGPTMLLMHAMVRDSVTSTGQPLVGCDFEIGLEDLALVRADAYFLGHVHKGQDWLIGDAPAIYPGSPRRTNFGELEPKGYVVAEWDWRDDVWTFIGWQFVEAPATRMVQLEADFLPDGTFTPPNLTDAEQQGAEVRFRYHVASDQRQAARTAAEAIRAELLGLGAVMVKVEEEVRLERRTRADAIAANAPLAEKVAAFWKAKGFDPADRREALMAKLQRVEEVGRAAA